MLRLKGSSFYSWFFLSLSIILVSIFNLLKRGFSLKFVIMISLGIIGILILKYLSSK